MARAAGGRVLSPGVPGEGMNPFVIDKGDSEEMLQRIGSLRKLIEVMVGERLSAERRASLDHALAGYYAKPRKRTGFRDFYAYLQQDQEGDPGLARLLTTLRHGQSQAPALRRGRRPPVQRGVGHRLRPEAAGAGAAARRGHGLHRDGVGGSCPGPQAPSAGGRRSMEHHATPGGCRLHGVHGQEGKKAPAGTCSSSPRMSRTCFPRTPRGPSPATLGRALLQNAAFKLLLQQDAAAIRTVGDAFDLPQDLQRWLMSCPRGDGLLLAKGNRFPVRIEATPEETEVIEWRPGRHA